VDERSTVFPDCAMQLRVREHQEGAGQQSLRMQTTVVQVLDILESASRQLRHTHQAAESCIRQAASLLQEHVNAPARDSQGETLAGGLLAWQIQRVMDYIDKHIGTHMPVAEMGRILQLSEAHFARAFRRTFGQPPHAFLVKRRIQLAARLMLTSDTPLSEIALTCGFADQAHLCKQFRRLMGESPAAWRRNRHYYSTPSASARATA
jgi:AraC family transcriptional regulator